jgi:hypothetical protein
MDISPVSYIHQIVTWTQNAAKEHVEYCRSHDFPVDPEGGIGLWRSFQEKFSKEKSPKGFDYNLAVALFMSVYWESVKSLDEVIPTVTKPVLGVIGTSD